MPSERYKYFTNNVSFRLIYTQMLDRTIGHLDKK